MENLIFEICAAVAGLLYLFYAIKQRPVCWGCYLVSAVAYVPVFFAAQLYIYAVFQVIFMITGLVGLITWQRESTSLAVKKLTAKGHLTALLTTIGIFAFATAIFPGSPAFYADLLLSILTVIATVLTGQKYIDNWHYWKVVNALGIVTALVSGLFPTAFLFLANLIFSFVGFKEWEKSAVTADA